MEPISLDLDGIYEYQQNRPPFLMIDCATEIVPGKSAKGYKTLDPSDWFFKVHFPNDPNMPGMLQVEALVQLGALMVLTLPGFKGKVAYLTSATNIKLKRKVVPHDRLDLDITLLSWNRGIGKCHGEGAVAGELACQADFTFVLPDILSNFKVLDPNSKK